MKVKICFCLFVCAVFTAFASAQVLGKVDYIEGKVEIQRDGSALAKVDIGTPVENLDMVRTSGDGLLTIAFTEASGLTGSLQVTPGTTAVIRQDQIPGSASNEVRLMTGSVNLKVKKLVGMNSSIQVKTPTSIAGVRGTEFVVTSFNGASLVACKEGEVACDSWSEVSGTQPESGKSVSSVPGVMVEVQESGTVKAAKFPDGKFEAAWKTVESDWKSYYVSIVASDSVSWLNMFVKNWDTYSGKLSADYDKLRANATLSSWLSRSRPAGNMGTWVKERPSVMKDLIAARPHMVMGMMTWYRLQDVISCIPQQDMGKTLSNGKTVRQFVADFRSSEKKISAAIALFNAAEKQYMLRNDGVTPFSEF
jgi:hypothetical protein